MKKSRKNSSLFVNENLFFLLENGEILAWNYKSHEQYLLEAEYFLELVHLSKNGCPQNEAISKELTEAVLASSVYTKPNEWCWDIQSRIFHLGTQNVYNKVSAIDSENVANVYFESCKQLNPEFPPLFLERDGPLVNLPVPDASLFKNVSFYDTLLKRKTHRSFDSEMITQVEFSALLFASFGLIHGEWEDLKKHGFKEAGIRKSSPSSGGMHAEEIYIVAYQVEGIQKGLYHYRPHDHQLTLLKEGDFEEMVIDINYQQHFSKGLAFGVYITSRLEKIWWKYKHSRSYRMSLLDIGHVSQSFLLCATALGWHTWLSGAFQDSAVEDFLSIDGNKEIPLLFVGAGKGSASDFFSQVITTQTIKGNR